MEAEDNTAAVATINPDSMEKLTVMLDKLMDQVESLERYKASAAPEATHTPFSEGRSQPPPSRRQRRGFSGVCWNCQQPGHLTRNTI